MAIVDIKKITLLAAKGDKESILHALQRLRCVQIMPLADADLAARVQSNGQKSEELTAEITRISWAIKVLDAYAQPEKKGMMASFAPKPVAHAKDVDAVLARKEDLMRTVQTAEACERTTGELRTREARIDATRDLYIPWLGLDVPLDRLGQSRATDTWLTILPEKHWQSLQDACAEAKLPMECMAVSIHQHQVHALMICHRSVRGDVDALLRDAEATQVSLPATHGTVTACLEALEKDRAALIQERDALAVQWITLATDVGELKLLHDVLQAEAARDEAFGRVALTQETFFLQAWAPADRVDAITERLRKASPTCAITSEAPDQDEKPPTLLRNRRAVEPFEAVIENFSLPDPRSVDPTFIMAPFFACFFGMMVSDAGYGLVMAILVPLAMHFMKPKGGMRKMMLVVGIGGLLTLIWGALFDTWFGASIFEKAPLLNPMTQPLEMMGLCLGFGAIHLFTAAAIGAYKNFKRGEVLAGIVDQICWVALVLGLVMLILPQTAAIGQWMALGSTLAILLFTKRGVKNPLKRIMGGLGSLYGITSWLSDLLSYARLFGMGLATGVIGMVINMLAGMVIGHPSLSVVSIIRLLIGVLILAGGHTFNLGINALGAYVHACRLQYIEFFNKFYEDGGDPFRPLDTAARYVQFSDPEGSR